MIPASKSLLNRALIVKSFYPELQIVGDSNCEDVSFMKLALNQLVSGQDMNCGSGGTTVRFSAFRAARNSGTFKIYGSKRLFERPQENLIHILNDLGVAVKIDSQSIFIEGQGWKKPAKYLQLEQDKSSQFISALVLNSWDLDFDLEFQIQGKRVSDAYLNMTFEFVKNLGMKIEKNNNSYFIPKHQKVSVKKIEIEPDCSCQFSFDAAEFLKNNYNTSGLQSHLQPDSIYKDVLLQLRSGPIDINLNSAPDLFPVLSVLCAFTEGTSRLTGADQLVYKESNRIKKTVELLSLSGFAVTELQDGLEISGSIMPTKIKSFIFDPDEDHRMAMAAGLLKIKGYDIKIKNPDVVNKSYPDFWSDIGIRP